MDRWQSRAQRWERPCRGAPQPELLAYKDLVLGGRRPTEQITCVDKHSYFYFKTAIELYYLSSDIYSYDMVRTTSPCIGHIRHTIEMRWQIFYLAIYTWHITMCHMPCSHKKHQTAFCYTGFNQVQNQEAAFCLILQSAPVLSCKALSVLAKTSQIYLRSQRGTALECPIRLAQRPTNCSSTHQSSAAQALCHSPPTCRGKQQTFHSSLELCRSSEFQSFSCHGNYHFPMARAERMRHMPSQICLQDISCLWL